MRYEIILAPQAEQSYRKLPAHVRATVRDSLETHLRHEPAKTSKSRIKRLRKLRQPQYRLRVEELRIFYDVTRQEVQVLAIVTQKDAQTWLDAHGTSEP